LPTWKLTIEYDGTRYRGWQEQRNARTIAGALRQASIDFFGAAVDLGGAGRTDAGVHALEQVAHLRCAKPARTGEIRMAINDRLPPDINILSVQEAAVAFDSRREAVGRYYLFQISTRRTAFAKPFVWWVKDRLDLDRVQAACQLMVGRHDFINFSEKLPEEKSTVVVVERAEVGQDQDLVLIRIGASHFLWKMVRRIVGALIEVGRGNLGADDIKRMLRKSSDKDSSANIAGHTAPPSGLFLEKVVYRDADRPKLLRAAFPVRRVLPARSGKD
jgi:tRNA pseudouridine38-40 synthase